MFRSTITCSTYIQVEVQYLHGQQHRTKHNKKLIARKTHPRIVMTWPLAIRVY